MDRRNLFLGHHYHNTIAGCDDVATPQWQKELFWQESSAADWMGELGGVKWSQMSSIRTIIRFWSFLAPFWYVTRCWREDYCIQIRPEHT